MSEFITAARPYAKALVELAQNEDRLEAWSEQLAYLAAIVSDGDFQQLMNNPKLTKEALADLLIDIAGDNIDHEGQNLVRVLAENGRLPVLPEIAMLFEQARSEAEGAIDATVVSAFELSDEQKGELEAALKKRLGRDVKLSNEIDNSLLGGAIIRAGDLVIDGSLKGRLAKLSATLTR